LHYTHYTVGIWPECLQHTRCPRPLYTCEEGCTRVPDAECFLDCHCQLMFTDRRNGKVLTAEECGRG